jgi:hypothetical protein
MARSRVDTARAVGPGQKEEARALTLRVARASPECPYSSSITHRRPHATVVSRSGSVRVSRSGGICRRSSRPHRGPGQRTASPTRHARCHATRRRARAVASPKGVDANEFVLIQLEPTEERGVYRFTRTWPQTDTLDDPSRARSSARRDGRPTLRANWHRSRTTSLLQHRRFKECQAVLKHYYVPDERLLSRVNEHTRELARALRLGASLRVWGYSSDVDGRTPTRRLAFRVSD